jgi:hypothetical protein
MMKHTDSLYLVHIASLLFLRQHDSFPSPTDARRRVDCEERRGKKTTHKMKESNLVGADSNDERVGLEFGSFFEPTVQSSK